MLPENNVPIRKGLRLHGFDYRQSGAYFVTICAAGKSCIFGEIRNNRMIPNRIGEIVQDNWTTLPVQFPGVRLDFWILMPNHFHGIIFLDGDQTSLCKVIGFFKKYCTSSIRKIIENPYFSVWQRSFHDHIVRNEMDLLRIRNYIATNPEKWATDPYFVTRTEGGTAVPSPTHNCPTR